MVCSAKGVMLSIIEISILVAFACLLCSTIFVLVVKLTNKRSVCSKISHGMFFTSLVTLTSLLLYLFTPYFVEKWEKRSFTVSLPTSISEFKPEKFYEQLAKKAKDEVYTEPSSEMEIYVREDGSIMDCKMTIVVKRSKNTNYNADYNESKVKFTSGSTLSETFKLAKIGEHFQKLEYFRFSDIENYHPIGQRAFMVRVKFHSSSGAKMSTEKTINQEGEIVNHSEGFILMGNYVTISLRTLEIYENAISSSFLDSWLIV